VLSPCPTCRPSPSGVNFSATLPDIPKNRMFSQARLDAFKADFEAGKPPYSVSRSVRPLNSSPRALLDARQHWAHRRSRRRRHDPVVVRSIVTVLGRAIPMRLSGGDNACRSRV